MVAKISLVSMETFTGAGGSNNTTEKEVLVGHQHEAGAAQDDH